MFSSTNLNRANAANKQRNLEKVKESQTKANVAYKQSNSGKRKVTLRKADDLYRQSNPETVKASGQKSSATYRQLHPEKVKASSKISNVVYRQNHPENYKVSQKKQYLKRNLATSENETDLGLNKHKRCKYNPESQISMSQGHCFIKTLMLVRNIFVHVVNSYGINHQLLNAILFKRNS